MSGRRTKQFYVPRKSRERETLKFSHFSSSLPSESSAEVR